MKRHTHSHTHGERILIDEIAYASALRQVSPMWKIFVSLYSLFLCLSSHTWVISVLILCAMLIAMTAIRKTRWHHIIRLMQIPLAFVILGCIMILLQVSHHGEKMLLAIPVGSWYFGVTAESVHQFGQVFLQCLAAVSCLYFLSTSHPDDGAVYGAAPDAHSGISGGDDGTGLSVYFRAAGGGISDTKCTGVPSGICYAENRLLFHRAADL